ncbi:unnamed protein product [marine sediment metagenome]|uniref:Uncharacterized protein n=1 Tax=marine sediment metagenome TaxID=412755 RepID=X1KLK5_9ZZZZ
MKKSYVWPTLDAFGAFVCAWIGIPFEESYYYHGIKMRCKKQPSPSPCTAYFTSKPPEWEWDPSRAEWLSPTGFIDPNADPTTWYNEEKAYDGDTGIFAIGRIHGSVPPGVAWGTFIWYTPVFFQ